MEKEDALDQLTFRGTADSVKERVMMTLTDLPQFNVQRTQLLVAELLSTLMQKGLIGPTDLDEMLFAIVT